MTHNHRVSKNLLTLLKNGESYFPALCADIDAARFSVQLETYIFSADEAGQLVAGALRRAAERGVSVYLMIDGFGSAELPDTFVDGLRMAGVEVQWFRRRISPFTLRRNRLRRMHRKLAAIDGEIAYVGGINIINDIPVELQGDVPRLDYAVRIQGDLAGEIQVVMLRLWKMVSWVAFRRRVKTIGWKLRRAGSNDDPRIKLVLRDNLRHRREIERAYLKAIAEAKHEIIIASAYFLPGRLFPRALAHAVKRGVRVILLLQGKVEYRLQHYATLALYQRLLRSGVEIYEYHASYMHAKVAVVDGVWATVGSSNIDPFSMLLAREANIVVRDAGFSAELHASLSEAIEKDGKRIMFESSSLAMSFISRVIYVMIRLVIGLLGISRRH